ncbi:type 1 glutamine amidotransferase [Pseudoclavibacter sp. 13-3]|uniref:type 1 glutamine amidotransferase n=1 Tax=Pseudoclavibacter sp. 13-3 TaxID=2901228 RepID=UPI001E4CE4C5|nr:type 1 glutamine amidotransferase [Pseudoclavibacter sp. 13-3]MCD7101262.1 type 1 glutamine amidotransferase [Pseudoclavibacter sp. 13-3]
MPTTDRLTARTAPRVLVVVNSASSGLRRLEEWLQTAGLDLDQRLGSEGLPETLEGFDALVMLGGGLMPDDDDRAPWLARERQLAAEAIDRDLPTLGICLGGQVLAQVCGGEVKAKTGVPERGMTRIETTPAGRDDAVIGALSSAAPMIENHEDRITALSDRAVLLASSADCEFQAFRLGRHVRGLQFHPEVNAERLRTWDDAALAEQNFDLAALIADAEQHSAENTAVSRALADAFAAEVREHAEAAR